jgi:acylphosphatase
MALCSRARADIVAKIVVPAEGSLAGRFPSKCINTKVKELLSEICSVEKTLRLLVSGRVQRVGYREACRKEAERLGLKGWVCNLADGRVELQACGEVESLKKLFEWCQRGPWLASVTEVRETESETPCTGEVFSVLR